MENLTIAAIIASVMFVMLILILVYSIENKDWVHVIIESIGIIMCLVVHIYVTSEINNISSEPTAIDVYRGLTELEITSVNGVPKDTVVVFKKI